MYRFSLLMIALATISGCTAQGELTSPCACLETPINPTEDLPA